MYTNKTGHGTIKTDIDHSNKGPVHGQGELAQQWPDTWGCEARAQFLGNFMIFFFEKSRAKVHRCTGDPFTHIVTWIWCHNPWITWSVWDQRCACSDRNDFFLRINRVHFWQKIRSQRDRALIWGRLVESYRMMCRSTSQLSSITCS